MTTARPPRAAWLALGAGLALAGCQNPGRQVASPFVGNQPAMAGAAAGPLAGVGRTQAQVMDFADDFTLRLADLTDRIEARHPPMDARIAIHRLRYTMAHGLTVIAASANPQVALIDAVVVMSIQRRLVEERLVPEYFEQMPWLANVFRDAEQQIKAAAAEIFTPEQMAEIQTLADAWVDENKYRYYGAYVRLADFAGTRQATATTNGARPASLLGFLTLDPLAGLDPATREIEQTRLFAERAMFYLQRMPQLISWQAELLYIDTASEPEVEQALLDFSSVAAAVERLTGDITSLREDLPRLLAAEREAAIEQAGDRFFEGLAEERRATLDDLAGRAEELDRTLARLTSTIEAGDELAGRSTELVRSIESLAAKIQEMRGPEGETPEPRAAAPGAAAVDDPTTIEDYERTIESATVLVERLDGLVAAVTTLAESDAWEERRRTIDAAVADAQQRVEGVVDTAYRRALVLIIVLLAGLLLVGLVLKLVPARRRVAA